MAQLIAQVFTAELGNDYLGQGDDGARLPAAAGRLVMATDAHVVSPLFFPGGDIGSLAVHGTLNDVSVMGARPLYLAAAFVLEEGFPIADLARIVASMARACREAGGAGRHGRHQGRRIRQGGRGLHHDDRSRGGP